MSIGISVGDFSLHVLNQSWVQTDGDLFSIGPEAVYFEEKKINFL